MQKTSEVENTLRNTVPNVIHFRKEDSNLTSFKKLLFIYQNTFIMIYEHSSPSKGSSNKGN